MLHTKYQGSRPCGFRQEAFLRFPYVTLNITNKPPGVTPFRPRVII
jgi:hypothetical protein